MKITLFTKEEKQEYEDMKACYKAIKEARLIRKAPVVQRKGRLTYTHIPMTLWEVLQPVIEVESEDRDGK